VDGLAKMQHPDRVVRLGYVDDYRRHQLLKGALILAYPSLYEGFGFPPLQAMSLGVPVVTTNAGALPETVGDGGVIVEPQQPESLAIAISKLLADGKVREQFIKAGFERVKEFTWDKCAQGLVSLYERAIDERFPNRKSSPRRSS
jgi:alpha-1,3-rhamnosyl/mannosyltransferase